MVLWSSLLELRSQDQNWVFFSIKACAGFIERTGMITWKPTNSQIKGGWSYALKNTKIQVTWKMLDTCREIDVSLLH